MAPVSNGALLNIHYYYYDYHLVLLMSHYDPLSAIRRV